MPSALSFKRLTRGIAGLTFLTAVAGSSAIAQNAGRAQGDWDPAAILRAETFVKPPAVVERIIMTPRTDISLTTPAPDRRWFLRELARDRGRIADYGRPHLWLAGVQVDARANRARSVTTSRTTGLALMDPRTRATRAIETPAGATIAAPVWSPTGTQVAFIANFDDASYPYVADVATGRSTRVSSMPLLATIATSLAWTADGRQLFAVLVPARRGAAPTHGPNNIEDGPQVRLTEGKRIPQVMHFSLLADAHDAALLAYHTTGQLAAIDVRTRGVRPIGAPAMIRAVDPSPDGRHVLVTRVVQPFSYRVPASAFGTVQELWDADGRVVATVASTPLREGERQADGTLPTPAPDSAPRNVQWNPAGPGLVYLQSVLGAAPAGRGGAAATPRATVTAVRYMNWLPPYGGGDRRIVHEGSARLTGVTYSVDRAVMFVNDSGAVAAVRVSEPARRFPLGRGVTLGGGGGRGGGGPAASADTGAVGGALVTRRDPQGEPAVVVGSDGRSVFLTGTRAPGANWNRQAPRPWVDRLDFESGQRTRIFESPADRYEEFVTALDDDHQQIVFTRESPTVVPDAWLRDRPSGRDVRLTENRDAAPEVTGAQRRRIQVTRPRDGLKFWVEVTLPRDWRPGIRLPGVIWFYPREYTSQQEYDRSRYATNINRFPAVPSARPATATNIWVTQGYAFIEPDAPVIGDSGRMNDNYIQDLTENLDAVVDAVVEAGFVDRNRMGLGGHSYGAFSTVNAMTVVPYFRAGIAGDGMYNRSLTPFGFQGERRSFFEAQDAYLAMSPFFRAHKLSGALLLYHATEDQNVGTHPMSSERMFHALQGLGKTAALYMYPYEDHSVSTYESDLDMWARWIAWFDLYVKNPRPTQAATP